MTGSGPGIGARRERGLSLTTCRVLSHPSVVDLAGPTFQSTFRGSFISSASPRGDRTTDRTKMACQYSDRRRAVSAA